LIKIILKKTTSAIFLAIVLLAGTFAAISPSSFIIGVNAQSEYEYSYGYDDNNIDNNYNSADYPSQRTYEYPQQSSYEYESNFENDDNYYSYPPTTEEPISADIVVPIDFDTIQEAVDAANEGDIIKVLPGIYTEQIIINKSLTIIGSGAKSTIIQAPDVLNPSPVVPFPGRANIVDIFNEAIVTMKGFTIAGPSGNICEGLAGVSIQEDATLEIDSSAIIGCLREGILVGLAEFIPIGPNVGHAVITKTDIIDYRVVGIQIGGEDTTVEVSKSQVIAADAPEVENQIGIFGAIGPKAVIVDNKISGNICKNPECGPDFFTQVQHSGIFLLDVNQDSIIAGNKVTNNDLGIAVAENSGCCKIENNKLYDNRFFGITIVDGEHTISNTKIFGGKVGAAAIATFNNTSATLDQVKIVGAETPVQALSTGNLTAAVNVLSPSFFAP
jgi:parallel beta-helix repeat protein